MTGRTCRYCGDLIDPVAYCTYCAECAKNGWGTFSDCPFHERLRRGPTARFCGKLCRERFWSEQRKKRPSTRHGLCKWTARLI